MENRQPGWTLGELAAVLGGTADGNESTVIRRAAPAGSDDPEGLTFAESPEYLAKAEVSEVGAILVPLDSPPSRRPLIRVPKPRVAFGQFLAMCVRPLPLEPGVHPTAVVSPEATVSPSASVGPYAVVERGAVIGDGCRVFPFCYVGENCRLGNGTVLFPHVVLYQDVELGERCIVHAGVVIGADGFGFVWTGTNQMKVPQVGGVEVGSEVEIGALSAIDRATAGNTRVGDDTKIDNLVQVGHNCRIGAHTVIASHVGLSGSTTIGDRVQIAGQAATSPHVSVTSDVILAGRTGVTNNIDKPGAYYGLPARPHIEAKRVSALNGRLPELYNRIKQLEKRLEELEK
jgi:UDP-3-O-[3-hydroxymyristoyl] glucosamine N-acyltransferase